MFAGTKAEFTQHFKDNEALYNKASNFWTNLESLSFIIVLICLILGVSFSVYYYKSYNNYPGRRYTPVHWLIFLVITIIVTFALTWGFEALAVSPIDKTAQKVEMNIAIGNAVWVILIYLITSVVCCNIGKTNAYKLFKF